MGFWRELHTKLKNYTQNTHKILDDNGNLKESYTQNTQNTQNFEIDFENENP